MACHLVYLTMNSFDEMTQGSTAAFYDRHLANLLEAAGELTVLHFHASGGQGCRAHPRLGPRVSHRDGDSSSLTIRALWRWIMRGRECIRGNTMLYLPYASPFSLVAVAWSILFGCRIYHRYTWSEIEVSRVRKRRLRRRLLVSLYERAGLKRASFLGAGSPGLVEHAKRLGYRGAPPALTTNFVFVDNLPVKERYGLAGERARVGFVGRFSPEKRVEWLIAAARELPIELHLIGDGEGESSLREQAQELPVYFHGRLANRDVLQHLATFDLFAFPSSTEAVPKALLEAMGAGLPCLGCDVAGIREWLAEGRGVVSPNTLTGYIASLRSLIGDESLRKRSGEAAREYVLHHHTPEIALAADREYLTQALRGSGDHDEA